MSKKVKERRRVNRLKQEAKARLSTPEPLEKPVCSNRGAFRRVLEYEMGAMERDYADYMKDAFTATSIWNEDPCVMCGNFACRCPDESAVPSTSGIRVRGSDGIYWIYDEAMLDRSCVLCGYTGHGDCNCPATPFESWVRWRSLEAENR